MLYPQNNQKRRNGLSENSSAHARPYKYGESVFAAISVGAVFILIGTIFVITPELIEKIIAFFSDFSSVRVPNTGIYLPAPTTPATHTGLYVAVAQFSLGVGILQILLLSLRLFARSPINKTAETMGNLVFWFGAYYLVSTMLTNITTLRIWFVFWTGIIVLIGASLIVRALVLLAKR
jgi:hypothetical protein